MMQRLLLFGLPLLGAVALAGPSYAHQRADVMVVSPAEGATVDGDSVEVVVAASSAAALAEAGFILTLDGDPIDSTGAVGTSSVFTTFSLRSGSSTTLRVSPVPPGPHELRLIYDKDGDNVKPDVVRRFTRVGGSPSATISPMPSASSSDNVGTAESRRRAVVIPWAYLLGGAIVVGAGIVVLRRRRERAQSGE